ncbi:MAG: tetratricopeptide repeat protein [Bacteroidota bacterium]
MIKWNILFLILCCSSKFYAQQSSSQWSQDSIAIAKQNNEVWLLLRDHPDSAIQLVLPIIELANQKNVPQEVAKGYLLKGNAERRSGDYEAAVISNKKAVELYGALKDSLSIAKAHQGLGNVYRQTGDYALSLQQQLLASKIQERNAAPQQDVARTYNQIATVFSATEDYKKAIQYFKKSLHIWQGEQQPQMIAICHLNIGGQQVELQDFDNAERSLLKSKALFDSLQLSYGISAAVTNLGNLYLYKEDYASAKLMLEQALIYDRKRKDKGLISETLSLLGEVEMNLGNNQKAIRYYQEALNLATDIGRKVTIKNTYERLSELYAKTEKYDQAFDALQNYTVWKDSLLNEKTRETIAELRIQYETAEKEQAITLLEKEQALEQRKRNGLYIGIGVLLMSLLGIFLSWRTAQKANQQLQAEQIRITKLLEEKEELLNTLKQTQEQLIQTDKMASLGQLTAGVAHEINNPISFVSSNILALKMNYQEIVGLLKKVEELKTTSNLEQTKMEIVQMSNRMNTRYLSAEINQLIAGIERGVKRTKNIVKSLSTFSRNTTEEFQPADLNEGLRSTLTLLKSNISDTIEIQTDYGELPEVVCQISPLNQVFLNIINNAAQAIDGTGQIKIKTWQDQNQVKIQISNTGKGMSKAILNRIFEPFFTTKEVGKGTGLGLSISYGIIQNHQGDIQVESEEGRETTFTIHLPIEQGTHEA